VKSRLSITRRPASLFARCDRKRAALFKRLRSLDEYEQAEYRLVISVYLLKEPRLFGGGAFRLFGREIISPFFISA
jgi:hypothetical protein